MVKQWDAALDGKTRDFHRRVDGEIRELDEKFSNSLMFPGDPSGDTGEVINCRCTSNTRARWALDEEELKILRERAEYFGLDKAKNFEDFKEKYLSVAPKVVENSGKGNKMNVGIQFFANKSIAKQTNRQLAKPISFWENAIDTHNKKIANPAAYDSGWEVKTEIQRKGLINHWKKEMKHFQDNIDEAKAEIKKKGA